MNALRGNSAGFGPLIDNTEVYSLVLYLQFGQGLSTRVRRIREFKVPGGEESAKSAREKLTNAALWSSAALTRTKMTRGLAFSSFSVGLRAIPAAIMG